MKTRPIPATPLADRVAAMQRQGFSSFNIIRTLRLTPTQAVDLHLTAATTPQPCGHPPADIGGDDPSP